MPKSDHVISDATFADIPALIELLYTLFSIEQDFTPNAKLQSNGLQLIIQNPDHAVIKVVKTSNGSIIGMVSAQLVISSAQGTYSAWIEDMVIHADYRAQGFGRLLLETALQWAKDKGATRAQLLVDLDNQPAIGYYDHLGWQASRMGMRRLMLK
jgi:GNAT superfamily N-acetyltransferase